MPEPKSISQRAWDKTRATANVQAPAARSIAARLRVPWSKLLEIAFMAEPGRSIALGQAIGEKEQDWLTPEYISFALRLVARRRNKRTVTPREYQQERKALVTDERSHWLHGRKLLLPNVEQIRVAAGTWDEALRAAGLPDSKSDVYQSDLRSRRASSIIDILERCYQAHNAEPTSEEITIFARVNSIPFPRLERGRGWADYVREWKEQRASKGLDIPAGPPPKAQRPDYSVNVGAARPGEKRARERKDFEEAVRWVTLYLVHLAPGERATQRGYSTWAHEQDGAPSSSAFALHHGGWVKVRDAAWDRIKSGR
jgi:hypothetical protein